MIKVRKVTKQTGHSTYRSQYVQVTVHKVQIKYWSQNIQVRVNTGHSTYRSQYIQVTEYKDHSTYRS